MNKKQIIFPIEIKAVNHPRSYILQKAFTNDLNSVELVFKLTDCTTADLTGATASILLFMRDGSFFQDVPTISGTDVKYTLTEAQGNHAGVAQAQIIVKSGADEWASDKQKFEIIAGLETQVATEVIIKDWTMLTAEARTYLDEFAANEVTRETNEDVRKAAEVAREIAHAERTSTFNSWIDPVTGLDARIDNIITTPAGSVSAQEIIDARDGEASVGAKIRSVDAQLAETATIYTGNYKDPSLVLNDFSGYNQPYHPSVLYLPNGFAGYKYWMVQSPFPNAGVPYPDRWECPVVYKSNDGIEWIIVANPLDDLTQSEITNGDYFSDPHMVYRQDLNRLEVWYRLTKASLTGFPTNIIRKTTSDGVTWSIREEMVADKLNTATDFMRSPAILWDNTNGKYRAWYQNNTCLYYNTSSDGKTWGTQQPIIKDVAHDTWHLDVNYFNGAYHLLSFKHDLLHYTSVDGIKFNLNTVVLSPDDGNAYFTALYRSCSLLDNNGKVRVYFSGTNAANKSFVGLLVGDTFKTLKFYNDNDKMVKGSKVLLYNGEPLDSVLSPLVLNKNDAIKVFPKNYFSASTPYTSFEVGVISQNIITSANASGTPNNKGGLLITDRTGEKSLELEAGNMTFQIFKELPQGEMSGLTYFRSTKSASPFAWGDWTLNSPLAVRAVNQFNCTTLYADFPQGTITHNVVGSANLTGTPNGKAGLLITDKSSGLPDFSFQTFKEKSQGSVSGPVYHRSTDGTASGAWLAWIPMT